MPSGMYTWSQTPASNGIADSGINFQEGQAPSTVNDSARAMMAVLKKHDDDISGTIVTGGTSGAYTLSSNTVFANLSGMNGQMIAFTPHTTNTADATLTVDGLGAKPIRATPGVAIPAGVLIQSTPYTAIYNNTDGVWYLRGFFGNPYNVPFLGGLDYWDSVAPNSSFIFPAGQAISRATYAAAFARWGTTYGAGDGSTTFNVPDKTGRVSAMKENSATRPTSSFFGGNSTLMGATGGSESHTLTTAQLAAHTHINTLHDPGHFHSLAAPVGNVTTPGGSFASAASLVTTNTNTAGTGITITNASAGSGNAHNNVPPTIVCNYIIRIVP